MKLFSALGKLLIRRPPPDAAVLAAIERLVDLVDPALRSVGGYTCVLEAPVHHALGYCEGLVGGLPGPIDIGHHAFAGDPLVHALFATAADIDRVLGESQDLRNYLAVPGTCDDADLYALLATRRCTKRVLGYASDGNQIRADVPQDLLYFTAHTLVRPESSLFALREALRMVALESLGKSFRAHVDVLRQERAGLQGNRSLAQAQLTALRGGQDEPARTEYTRRIAELDASLHGAVESLMPVQLLGAFANYLKKPEQLLRLERLELAVDRAGVLADAATNAANDIPALEFCELTSRDRRRNVILLVRIGRDAARASVVAADTRRDRFLII